MLLKSAAAVKHITVNWNTNRLIDRYHINITLLCKAFKQVVTKMFVFTACHFYIPVPTDFLFWIKFELTKTLFDMETVFEISRSVTWCHLFRKETLILCSSEFKLPFCLQTGPA